ncbi:unnamed protein product, partial [Urochloa humidicola]
GDRRRLSDPAAAVFLDLPSLGDLHHILDLDTILLSVRGHAGAGQHENGAAVPQRLARAAGPVRRAADLHVRAAAPVQLRPRPRLLQPLHGGGHVQARGERRVRRAARRRRRHRAPRDRRLRHGPVHAGDDLPRPDARRVRALLRRLRRVADPVAGRRRGAGRPPPRRPRSTPPSSPAALHPGVLPAGVGGVPAVHVAPAQGPPELYSVFIPHADVVERNASIEAALRRIPPAAVARMQEEVVRLIPRVMYRDPAAAAEQVSFKDAFDVAVDAVLRRVAKRRRAAAEGRECQDSVDGPDSWKYDLLEDGQQTPRWAARVRSLPL